ncbi:hypothetical protein H4R33_000813 [Dimargaris cristalligena]|uniref:Cupin-like domain-containing protein n=1 Tax=Dimargaris cristalligena TaxID=215637 RepID=A0A4Q0A083_9FUNG|nr:hypothetical protein H4R33_000813 [Dimargaris cristalligena]RKP39433.1 cupin-like domain-containing protein [Dimargaris cristalligena]|eukprot:RKP39433.1 cupin-like domain-containing protein [Dimargaris cristalligena]
MAPGDSPIGSLPADQLHAALRDLVTEAQELNVGAVTELDQVPTPLEFMRYVAQNRPFVVRGGARHWPARTQWSNDHLRSIMGDQLVTVAITPNGYADALVDGRFFVEPFQKQMPFGEVVDILEQKQAQRQLTDSTARPPPKHYLAYHYYIQSQNGNIEGDYQRLKREIPADIDFATEALGYRPDAVNFWMGEASSVTSLHKDPYENIYVVLAGSKTFTLYPPTECYCLYERFYQAAEYHEEETASSPSSVPRLVLKPKDDHPDIPWVSVDPLDSSPETQVAHPRFHQLARPLTVTVNSGDMLYLPALWYHHVQQRQDIRGRVIAVNYWYDMNYSAPLFPYFKFAQNIVALVHPPK